MKGMKNLIQKVLKYYNKDIEWLNQKMLQRFNITVDVATDAQIDTVCMECLGHSVFRRSGRTTRLVDNYIQELFINGKVKVSGYHPGMPSDDDVIEKATFHVMKKIVNRLRLEHSHVIVLANSKQSTIEIVENRTPISNDVKGNLLMPTISIDADVVLTKKHKPFYQSKDTQVDVDVDMDHLLCPATMGFFQRLKLAFWLFFRVLKQ